MSGIDEMIQRINELYHKSQAEGLTAEEKEEQARLAAEAKKKKEYFHRRDPVHVGDTYRDYLGDCVALNLNLDDRSVLFPPDLPAAHQRTIEMLRYREIKAKTKNFKKAVEKLLPMASMRVTLSPLLVTALAGTTASRHRSRINFFIAEIRMR